MEGYFGTGFNRYQGDGFRMTRIVRFMATYSESFLSGNGHVQLENVCG